MLTAKNFEAHSTRDGQKGIKRFISTVLTGHQYLVNFFSFYTTILKLNFKTETFFEAKWKGKT